MTKTTTWRWNSGLCKMFGLCFDRQPPPVTMVLDHEKAILALLLHQMARTLTRGVSRTPPPDIWIFHVGRGLEASSRHDRGRLFDRTMERETGAPLETCGRSTQQLPFVPMPSYSVTSLLCFHIKFQFNIKNHSGCRFCAAQQSHKP